MNKTAYLEELDKIVPRYVNRTYDEWKSRIIDGIGSERLEYLGDDGTDLQVVILAVWDDKPNDLIRISFTIDDGGWRAFIPISRSEVVTPSNEYL